MNGRIHTIITRKENDVIGLKTLLFELSREHGYKFAVEGGLKCMDSFIKKNGNYVRQPPIHHEDFIFKFVEKNVGKYGFKLEDNVYVGTLNLRGFPEPMYEQIMNRLQLQFPKLFRECVTSK